MEIPQEYSQSFVAWLLNEITIEARGDRHQQLAVAPIGRFWLGRLAPEERIQESRLGERAERLEPCECGFRVRPTQLDGRPIRCRIGIVAWREIEDAGDDPDEDKWVKTDRVEAELELKLLERVGQMEVAGHEEISQALTGVGAVDLAAEVHAEIEA